MAFFGDTSSQQQGVEKRLANIGVDAINTNQQAIPVPYLAGRAYVTGLFISPAYNPRAVPIQTQTGKDQSDTTGYKYFADFALVFCMGGRRPVDAIYKVIVDNEIAWRGNIQRGQGNRENITVPNYGTIHLYWGTETQGVDNILLQPRSAGAGDPLNATTWDPNSGPNPFQGLAAGDPNPYSGHYDEHPAYRGQCYAVFKNWKLGRDRTSVPNISLELKRGCPWVGGAAVTSNDLGVVPAAILYDWLTDTRFGIALPESALDTASFIALYNKQNTQGWRLSVQLTQQSDFRQLIAEIMEYYDGWIRSNLNNQGKLEVGMWSHGTITSAGTLKDDDLLGEPQLEPQGWGPTLNEFTVVYQDRQHHYNEYTQTHRDPNNFRITGGPRPIVLQRPWLTDAALAKKYVREYGAIRALPTTRGTLVVKREWLGNKLPGDVFLYQSGFYQLQFYLRLLQVEHASDDSASATLTVEWERAVWPSLFIPDPFQGPGGFTLGPRAIWIARITEVPYLLQDHRFLTQIAALAIRGNIEVIGFRVWASFDAGLTYQILATEQTRSFAAFGLVYAAFGPTVGGCWCRLYGVALDEVVTQTPAQQANDTLLCFIDAEVMSIGQVIAYGNGLYQIFFLRGRFGTTGQSHLANAHIYFERRADLRIIDNASFIPGNVVKFKLQPFTVDEDYDLNAITPINYTVVGWDEIPAPVLAPPGGPFVGSVLVRATAAAGMIIRYTLDGTPVFGDDLRFPAAGLTLNSNTTLRVRAFAANGRFSQERLANYTRVAQLPGNQQCAPPSRSFSGVRGQTAGNLTLTVTTTGSTIKFRKNNGAIQNYSSPIALACNFGGDTCEYWATKPGLDDSPHVSFDNTRTDPGGGGQGGGGPPHPPP